MKMYKKSKLSYKNGYLVTKKGKVVYPGSDIVKQLNKLEEDLQRARHERAVKECSECADSHVNKEFIQKSEFKRPTITPVTQNLDEAVEKAMNIIDDLDLVESSNKINKRFAEIDDLIQFALSDTVIEIPSLNLIQFDLPTIGNPLELTGDQVADIVTEIYHG